MCLYARTNVSLAGRNAPADGLEVDCTISVLRSNRRCRCRENHRRAKRDRVKRTLHVASPFSLCTHRPILKSPSYFRISRPTWRRSIQSGWKPAAGETAPRDHGSEPQRNERIFRLVRVPKGRRPSLGRRAFHQNLHGARTMASSARFSLERPSALSCPPERAGRVPFDPKASPRIRVSTIHPSLDVRPMGRAPLASSHFFRLRSRSSLNPLDAYRGPTSSNRADGRLRARAIARELFRQAASRLAFHPFVARGVAHGGPAFVHCDGCAALVGVAFRGSRWPQRARRRVRPPPALQPPAARAPMIV